VTPPDGRLTDELCPEDRPPRDACGVFGVWAPNEDVAKLAYYGLYALQHRGQEAAGIAVSDGSRIVVHKEMGLVAQVFDEPALTALRGHIAVGHCRYSTTGASVWANAQPTFRSTGTISLALGHNGNLINTRELAALLDGRGPGSTGIVGARFVREIEPGELVSIDGRGVRSRTFAAPKPSGCLFEYVYLARPDTTISGRGVHATRVAVGRRLAAEHPADADMVIPVPESGTPAAIGFAEASGLPFGQGLVKNSYVGRTFIQPSQP